MNKIDPNGYIKKAAQYIGPAAYLSIVAYNTYKETFENDEEKCFYASKSDRYRYAKIQKTLKNCVYEYRAGYSYFDKF